jgi:ATP-binding cassette subfamily B protein
MKPVSDRHAAATAAAATAAAAAAAAEDVLSLPGGLSYDVGARGSRLSGGQQQRVALARSLFRHAPVLVLDEPTAAQDQVTGAAVWRRLRAQRDAGTAVLVITHDITALKVRTYRLSSSLISHSLS